MGCKSSIHEKPIPKTLALNNGPSVSLGGRFKQQR